MRRSFCQFLSASLCVVVLVLGVGCERQSAPEALVLKVGVIASLSGEGQRDGAITVNCATVIADYYNEQGGVEVDGEHYRVELLVRDDTSEASQAAEIAYDFVNLGDVHYVIGAEGDAVSEAVAPILDSAGILYLHYGLSYRLLARASCGVLARPRSIQMFARVVDYLKENQDDQEELSICLLVGKTRAAMYQKLKIEEMVEQAGIEVVRFARFDVTEAVFDLSETPEVVESFVARVVSSQPSLVILCGQQDGSLPLAMSYLRGGGYTGGVIARSPRVLIDRGVEGSWVDGLLLVSSSVPIEERSRYYLDLKERYLDQFSDWNTDVDLKLYALESVLRRVALSGRDALSSSEVLLEPIQFPDPFLVEERLMGFGQRRSLSASRQLSVPIILSNYSEGEAQVVYRSDSSF